jgi:DNA helicase MCM8
VVVVLIESSPSLVAADLIFILLDRPDEGRDKLISEHILRVPSSSSSSSSVSKKRSANDAFDPSSVAPVEGQTLAQRLRSDVRRLDAKDLPFKVSDEMIRKYIEYARAYVHPRLTKSAAKVRT